MAETCLQLLRIPSVTGSEAAITEHLEQWSTSLCNVGRDDIIRAGNGLIIGTPDNHRPCIALVGHTDTVPACEGDGLPRQENDHIVGLGASDMKGSIAVMQTLFETIRLELLPFSLMLVLYDREEGDYDQNGLQPLLDTFELLSEIDLAIVMEPTDNTLQLGAVGSIQARILFTGKAAHSARPWQGDNAIHKAAELLTELYTRPTRDVCVEGLIFREVMSATLAKGGHSRNSVPDRFALNVNYRFAPSFPLQAATQAALAEIRRVAGDARVHIYDVAPPAAVPTDNPVLEHLLQHTGVEVQPKQAWTDVARLARADIDAVNFGPGFGDQAHQRGEFVSLDELERAYDILARVLQIPLAGVR